MGFTYDFPSPTICCHGCFSPSQGFSPQKTKLPVTGQLSSCQTRYLKTDIQASRGRNLRCYGHCKRLKSEKTKFSKVSPDGVGLGGGKSCCAGSVREWRVHCQGTEPAAKYVRQLANLYQIRGPGHRLSNIFPNWENFCSNRDKWNYICLFGCLTSLIQEIYSYSVGKSHTFAKSKSRRYRWVTI